MRYNYDDSEAERIARELHAHGWSSFLKWDSNDLSESTRQEYLAKARSGKMTKFDTMDGFVPEGMELVPYVKHETWSMDYKPRNESRPKDVNMFMPYQKPKFEQTNNIDSTNTINEILTADSPPKRRRGRPPGSKNKK